MLVAVVLTAIAAPTAYARRASSDSASSCDWRMYGHDVGHSFAQQPGCSSVTPTTVSTLAPKWYFPTPDAVTASPTIVGDTVYIGDWTGTFYALATDPPPGPVTPKWTFTVDDGNSVGFGRIVSSAAYTTVGGHNLVLFAGGATLYALDAATGARMASVCLDPRALPADRCHTSAQDIEVESSPAVVPHGNSANVVVGLDVHNSQHVGRTGIVSLSLRASGGTFAFQPLWKFDPEAGVAYTGADLLTVGSGTGDGCGGVWSSPGVDVAQKLVFFGTASCSVDGVTTGERMWAIRLDNGGLVWSYGPPRESTRYDDDFGASPNVLPGGIVGNGSKDGWYYAVDEHPVGGAPNVRWKTHVGESGHATIDFAVGGVLGSTATGTVNGVPAIFVTTAISTPLDSPFDAGPTLDTTLTEDPARMLSLSALRASDGAVLWRSPISRQSYGAPTFVNGVVLVPSTFDFSLKAFDANTGLPLADLPLDGPPASAPTAMGNSVYLGVGTSTGQGSPLATFSGVWAFRALAG